MQNSTSINMINTSLDSAQTALERWGQIISAVNVNLDADQNLLIQQMLNTIKSVTSKLPQIKQSLSLNQQVDNKIINECLGIVRKTRQGLEKFNETNPKKAFYHSAIREGLDKTVTELNNIQENIQVFYTKQPLLEPPSSGATNKNLNNKSNNPLRKLFSPLLALLKVFKSFFATQPLLIPNPKQTLNQNKEEIIPRPPLTPNQKQILEENKKELTKVIRTLTSCDTSPDDAPLNKNISNVAFELNNLISASRDWVTHALELNNKSKFINEAIQELSKAKNLLNYYYPETPSPNFKNPNPNLPAADIRNQIDKIYVNLSNFAKTLDEVPSSHVKQLKNQQTGKSQDR